MELKDILEKKLNSLGIKKQVEASQVCDAYNSAIKEIFGEDAIQNTEAISFKNGVLKVRVSNSSWAQEVQGSWGELVGDNGKIKRITFEI